MEHTKMILQYRVCQKKHVLLLFSGLFLGVSQILLVEGSVNDTSKPADPTDIVRTVTNSTSRYDLQSQNTSTEPKVYSSETLTDQATFEPTNGFEPNNSQATTLTLFATSYTDSETAESDISETTSDELHFTNKATTKEGTSPPPSRILIGCLVLLFFIIIIGCLLFSIKNRRKMSYSMNYNKRPEDSGIPLNNVKA
ncbi:uncharacterized protein ACMZJ9_021918 [Mantella aurantiaca]